MRIGTANLEGRWSQGHQAFLRDLDCDVWLLTEVNVEVALTGFTSRRTLDLMAPSRYWAAVLTKAPLQAETDPHHATAAARASGIRYLSSVLPWRSCGPAWPGDGLAEKTKNVLAALKPALSSGPVIWGGDWNHALEGAEFVGTLHGRQLLMETLDGAGLVVPTGTLPSASPGHKSIDHIAVPAHFRVIEASAVQAVAGARRLSDHDAYLVELELPE